MAIRIRAASTLIVILIIAFGLQLVAVLSVPVTKKIFLCEFGNYQFGVFGYCDIRTNQCSGIGIGYDSNASDFILPSNARKSLANLLIVHVVAAGLTLIMILFALLAHFHGPSSSSRYLLFFLIFSIPAFMISLLAFLVDILLFLSHLSWSGWIVLGSTVLLAISTIIICIMRRTLSSLKAVRKRGADFSELNDMGLFGNTELSSFNNNNNSDNIMNNKKNDNLVLGTFAGGALGSDPKLDSSEFERTGSNLTTNSSVPLNNDDDNSSNVDLHSNYRHASSRAYRGSRRLTPQASNNGSAELQQQQGTAVSTDNIVPAGTYLAEFEDESDNRRDYGPNVVPIENAGS